MLARPLRIIAFIKILFALRFLPVRARARKVAARARCELVRGVPDDDASGEIALRESCGGE